MNRLIIVGGSDAGISAALRIRELHPDIQPVVIDSGQYPNFSICGLPYYISREVRDWRTMAHRTHEDLKNEGLTLMLNHTVKAIDPAKKEIVAFDENGVAKKISYDKLLIATGAVSRKPNIPGIDEPGVFPLRWLPDCLKIDGFIQEKQPKSAVILGAGYIGMEMTEALAKRGLQVTLVEYADSVLPSMDHDLGLKLQYILSEQGVSVATQTSIESIESIDNQLLVKGTNHFGQRTDMVLISAGSAPNSELGISIGLETGLKGALKINRYMATQLPDIYAAGDCVETWHRVLNAYAYLPLGTVAHKQGRIAGENMLGGCREFAGTIGTQSLKFFDSVVARTGLNELEALRAGFAPVSADLETWDHKGYYPGARKTHVRVIADLDSRRILGAQMIGSHGTEVSKRIDIFATAIYHGQTIRDFSDYDLSYTPPLSSPWDPVQMAVQKLEKILEEIA